LETRTGPNNTTTDGLFQGNGEQPAGSITRVQITGRGGVPDHTTAVAINVTAVLPHAPGHLTMYACDTPSQVPIVANGATLRTWLGYCSNESTRLGSVRRMPIQLENVGIAVRDIDAAIAFSPTSG